MECGLIGLPNVGKSTLFNALTATSLAEAANYPFCTIDPHHGTVCVPDPRLHRLAEKAKSQKIIPTSLTFVDIAGLVEGASQGEGLGNQFLHHIRTVDALIHVVRCFQERDIIHILGRISPVDDIKIIETELMLADLQSLESRLGRKKKPDHYPLLEKAYEALSRGELASQALWEPHEKKMWKFLDLLTLKPMIYVCNVAETDLGGVSPFVQEVQAYAHPWNRPVLTLCSQIEAEVALLSEQDRPTFLSALGLEATGLSQLVQLMYRLLDRLTFFTVGPKETHAWTLPKGATAFDAAGVIHSDFQRGFIRAEVTGYDDYVRHTSLLHAKEEGKVRLEGKEYVITDGDIIHFRFNV